MNTLGILAVSSVLCAVIGAVGVVATLAYGFARPPQDVPSWALWLLVVGAAGVVGIVVSAVWFVIETFLGMMQ